MPVSKEEFNKRMQEGREKAKLAREGGQSEGQPADDTPKKATTPWRPARFLHIPESMKDPRFVYRFVNTKREGNELKKLQEGWEYDYELGKKLTQQFGQTRTIQDGTPIDTAYRIRELIVMRMPKEMAKARNDYYSKRGETNLRTMKESLQQGMDDGTQVTVYGNSKEERVTI